VNQNLVDRVKASTKFQTNKKALRESIQAELHVTYNSGLFYVTPTLIAFLESWHTEDMFLEDTYNNPVPIKRSELVLLAKERYQAVMNTWHTQYQELKSVRKV
jgi:hypothetical protein|tara:strand:- start:293 stop:601 length:309 start_codon:yes stop_codon:yes gene_type:complete